MLQTFKGTQDFFGDEARFRQQVLDIIRLSFEKFGFEPLETPIIENMRTLQGKYGEEGEQKIFQISKRGTDDAGLRYDHTVPLARFMAMNWSQFPRPYRRYAIGPVFRYETVQAGRFRQFVQCDFDTIGSDSPVIDAEIVAINYTILNSLGFGDNYSIRINDRRLLNAMANEIGFTKPNEILSLLRSWDKFEKTSRDQLRVELSEEGIGLDLIKRFDYTTDLLIEICGQPSELVFKKLEKIFTGEKSQAAIGNLRQIVNFISSMAVPENCYKVWPLLARGLDYYTGPIFETVPSNDIEGGSITGGGRFDELIATLGGPEMPASGSSFGLDRLLDAMEKLKLKPESTQQTQVFITLFDLNDPELTKASFRAASKLRLTGYRVEVYTGQAQNLGKQLDIANRKRIPFVLVFGPDEVHQNKVTIKDFRPGKPLGQTTISENDLESYFNAAFNNNSE
jgi:histidyl-tRNA synthetase